VNKLLIIDDNEAVCTALRVLFDLHGIDTDVAHSPGEGLSRMDRARYAVVIQDMNFSEDQTSGEEGVQLFRELRTRDPELPVLLVTAWSSLETAVQLVKEGANDYLSKPWDDQKLVEQVKELLAYRAEQCHRTDAGDLMGMVCEDPRTRTLVDTALQIARANVPVLIRGPNGSGKEVLAQIIQANSARRDKPFLQVNAGALPDELLESELFGAEAGAFTGARTRRIGRFEEADGGTLFLDEIGNLSLSGQMKLLRVLQTGEFSRLGSNHHLKSDVRIISATNADLGQAITVGTFRQDLYFRLNVVELTVPGLAERPGDIIPLARHFLGSLEGGADKTFSVEAERAMRLYDWPGNVRELKNRIQRAILIARQAVLTPFDLDLPGSGAKRPEPLADEETRERVAIERQLFEVGGNVSRAAERLGMSRQALYRRMARFGIVWERKPK